MPIANLIRALPAAAFLSLVAISTSAAQRRVDIAPNAPKDAPVVTARECQRDAMYHAMEPLIATARASFAGVRQRFEVGLPAHNTFFVTTRLHGPPTRAEQVFIAVDSIFGQGDSTRIAGRIWSPISVVQGYRLGQSYTFPIGELLDWTISKPDGTEEGNLLGKFLETYRPPASCAYSLKTGVRVDFPDGN
jgi:hypothetical protein